MGESKSTPQKQLVTKYHLLLPHRRITHSGFKQFYNIFNIDIIILLFSSSSRFYFSLCEIFQNAFPGKQINRHKYWKENWWKPQCWAADQCSGRMLVGGDGCGSGCWKHFLRVLWNVSNWHNVKNAKSYVTFNTIRLFAQRPEKGNFFTYFASEIVVKFWIYTCVALTSQKVNEMKRFTTDSVNWFLRLWGDFEASAGFLFHCQIYILVKYPKVWSICFALQQVTYLLTIIINWCRWIICSLGPPKKMLTLPRTYEVMW